MLKINTSEPKLSMREYGRNIQKLIEYCSTIEDREERTSFAYSIAETMLRLFPDLKDEQGENRKVWDHINVISGFKLDIDYPVAVLSENDERPKAEKIPYSSKSDRYRSYGRNLVNMIHAVSDMEGGVEKDQLIFLIANQMKKLLISENPETATDQRVFKDIKEISGHKIDIDSETYRLNEYIGIAATSDQKKKKKK